MRTECQTRARRLLAGILLLALAAARAAAAAADPPASAAIAPSTIAQFQAKIPPPANDRLDYVEAVAPLHAAFRAGEALEQANPNAPNLHVVRNAMLEIARRLASLEADDASRQRLMGLARRIVASPGPIEGKVWADSLLTQARLAKLDLGNPAAADEIKRFVSRYTDCPVTHVALMFAVDMATANGNQPLAAELTNSLMKYSDQRSAEAFLRNRGVAVFSNRSLDASLTTLDGTTLRLPRDLFGKVTVLHFWSIRSGDTRPTRAVYDQYHDRGLEVIGINVDRNRSEVESFIRRQDVCWPQVCTGKGFGDPLLKRLGIPAVPYYWVVGRDGRVALTNNPGEAQPPSSMTAEVKRQMETFTDLAERLPYYRSGEFLARTSLLGPASGDAKDPIAPADLEAVRHALLVSPWSGVSREEKIQAYKKALAAGQSLEEQHPAAGNLALVRSWMLIAARRLEVTTGDKTISPSTLSIAKRLLASDAAPASRLLADYVLASARLAALEPRSRTGARLIEDYARRYRQGEVAWAAGIMAYMLTLEDSQDGVGQTLAEQLYARYQQRPDPLVFGFLRECCRPNFSHWLEGPPLRVAPLSRMDGGRLTLPDDLLGKVVVLQFWSAAHPPRRARFDRFASHFPRAGAAPVVVVGINLDRNRADAEAFLKNSSYKDWIHTFSGRGWDDPLARACDVLALPRTIVLDGSGQIALGGCQMTDDEFVYYVGWLVGHLGAKRGRAAGTM